MTAALIATPDPEPRPRTRVAGHAPPAPRTTVSLAEHRDALDLMILHQENAAAQHALAERHKAVLKRVLGDAEGGVVDGRLAVSFKRHTRQVLDAGKLKAEHEHVWRSCLVEKPYRLFKVVDW